MKKLLLASAIVGATATLASAQEFKPYVGAEHKVEADSQKLYAGIGTDFSVFSIKAQANMNNTANTDWDYAGMDLDISTTLGNGMVLYMNNDLDSDWDRTETTIGVKYSF